VNLPLRGAEDSTGNPADLVTGRIPDEKAAPFERPRFCKSVGVGWEDLAVAAAVHRNQAP
jgi:ornithine cyclodeaminase